MAQLTLNFDQFDPQDEVYGGNAWLTNVKWRDLNNVQLRTGQGVYTIDNGVDCVYAGQADNVRSRFNGRSDVLSELRLRTAAIPTYRVFAASVIANPTNYLNKIDWAEAWLVRFLYLRDGTLPNRMLQNVNLTGPLTFPAGGINIRFDPGDAPAYLVIPGNAQYVVVNANSVGYNYAAGFTL